MKKLFFFLMSALCLASCGEDGTVSGGSETPNNPTPTEQRSTEVYVQGADVAYSSTRAMTEQTAEAYFFIRIDNTAPGLGGLPNANSYFPQTARGESVFSENNKGLVDLNYPYFKTSSAYEKYVYDTTGETTLKALVGNAPTIEQLVAANKNSRLNLNGKDLSEYKIIWYVVKKYEGVWHVDGILTKKSTTDVSEVLPDIDNENKDLDNDKDNKPDLPAVTPGEDIKLGDGNVEVDVHQQEHSTWDEIKSSIHVRDLVDEVKVEIPLEFAHVAEADDFQIRTYDYALESKVYLGGKEYNLDDTNPIHVTVEHQATKVVITVSCKNKEYIKKLREVYGDGITVEVHTYAKGLEKTEIWDRVKQTKAYVVPDSYKGLIFKGATNAFGFE